MLKDRIPTEYTFTALAVLAVVFCIGAGIVIGRYQGAVTITRTVQVRSLPTNLSAAQVVQALGKPDTTITGTQVNSQLTGFTCGVWASKHLLACW